MFYSSKVCRKSGLLLQILDYKLGMVVFIYGRVFECVCVCVCVNAVCQIHLIDLQRLAE